MEAKLSITEMRRSSRLAVNHTAPGIHPIIGAVLLAIENISAVGFKVRARNGIGPGDRLLINLPRLGRLQALCISTKNQQARFLFDSPIPSGQFEPMIASMKAMRPSSATSPPLAEQIEVATSEVPSVSHRKAERKRALAVASLCTPNGWAKVRVKDYSNTGVRFISEQSIPVGVDVIYRRGDVFAAAKIIWSTGNEAGLEFYREHIG